MTEDERRAVLQSLNAALNRLDDALAQPKTEWTRDASIQRFEFSFELAWKAIQRFAKDEGVDAASPRQAFRVALKLGWIEDDDAWLEMLEDRNRTSHTYREETAEQIYRRLGGHHARLSRLASRLGSLEER